MIAYFDTIIIQMCLAEYPSNFFRDRAADGTSTDKYRHPAGLLDLHSIGFMATFLDKKIKKKTKTYSSDKAYEALATTFLFALDPVKAIREDDFTKYYFDSEPGKQPHCTKILMSLHIKCHLRKPYLGGLALTGGKELNLREAKKGLAQCSRHSCSRPRRAPDAAGLLRARAPRLGSCSSLARL